MKLLISSSFDPYQNLATEEYLLKNSREDYIFLYLNQPCVVVGKHQNTQKEIDAVFAKNNNILIARRLSGGGAVYHDPGNLNFSFLQTLPSGEYGSYERITRPVFSILKEKIIPSIQLNERNDFILEGKKISGSAMHLYKDRVLAHGTLLINCNLENLSASLHGKVALYEDKAIASKKVPVINIVASNPILTPQRIIEHFKVELVKDSYSYQLSQLDETALYAIQTLVKEKYSQPEWIYGYSPKYRFRNEVVLNGSILHFDLTVVKGIIESYSLESNNELDQRIAISFSQLIGKHHEINSLIDWTRSAEDHSLKLLLLPYLI